MSLTSVELAALEVVIERVFSCVVGERLNDIESRLVGLTEAVTSLGGRMTGLEIEVRDMATRFSRLRTDIMTGRTVDSERLTAIESGLVRRLDVLEGRVSKLEVQI